MYLEPWGWGRRTSQLSGRCIPSAQAGPWLSLGAWPVKQFYREDEVGVAGPATLKEI